MHGVGDALPAGDLRGAMDTRRARIANALRRYLGRFGDDKAGTGALRVIGGVACGPGALPAPARLRVIGAITMRLGTFKGPR